MDNITRCLVIKRVILSYRSELSAAGGILFLAIDPNGQGRPSRKLLDLVSNAECRVRPVSEALVTPNGVFPRGSRQRTYILEIVRVSTAREGQITLEGQLYGGIRSSSRWRVQLRENGGKWIVSDVQIVGVS